MRTARDCVVQCLKVPRPEPGPGACFRRARPHGGFTGARCSSRYFFSRGIQHQVRSTTGKRGSWLTGGEVSTFSSHTQQPVSGFPCPGRDCPVSQLGFCKQGFCKQGFCRRGFLSPRAGPELSLFSRCFVDHHLNRPLPEPRALSSEWLSFRIAESRETGPARSFGKTGSIYCRDSGMAPG